MKLIDIQQKFFYLKGNPRNVYFCTEAETDACLNVTVVHYIQSDERFMLPLDWMNAPTMALRGARILDIKTIKGLGMAYTPASQIHKLNTQIPDSMGYDTHSALDKLKKAVGGDVTAFVCERLQWTREEIEERLFAEQVDAVALIIYNFEARNQAMIIGDQTGIGKGRVASSIIRYSIVHNLIPIYCTEKAGLFSDNYRDLVDIGCGDLVPFIINSVASGKNNACITTLDENDNDVVVHRPITDRKVKNKIYESGKLPEGYDYILTTYSQLQNAYKKTKDGDIPGEGYLTYQYLLGLAPHATFIFDESHNISGSKAVVEKWWDPGAQAELTGSNQFLCFNELCKKSKNSVFLSATFAKRPENMVVYANRTCISECGLNDTELISAIQDGGEALQEIISSDIVAEGQMIRRESIYEGIKVNYIYLDKEGAKEFNAPDLEKQHRSVSDYITNIINRINEFEQNYVVPIISNLNIEGIKYGDSYNKTSKDTGAQHTPLFSKLFQIVNQLLFSIKAEAVAEHAIRRLQEGKKVVIGISSTMETFLEKMDMDDDEKEMSCDFAVILSRALENTLKYIVKGDGGFSEKSSVEISELDQEGQEMYYSIKKEIANASSGISLSPIDLITQKIEAAVNQETGEHFVVTEVTGRKKKIEFTNKNGTKGRIVQRKYVTSNVAFSRFQNNQSDVLIINASGATGASAHATTKNTNLKPEQVKPRVMIIAQTELDVNKEVQKRGRINRTGQIKNLPPSYDYLISAIPAEKRLMMMLQKKLKSLDANSTSNQKQSKNVIDVPDFFNKYGDSIAYNYLLEHPTINDKLNDPINIEDSKSTDGDNRKIKEDFLKKVSGYVPLLTCDEQEDFYNTILENYNKQVDNLKKKGEYDLEVEAMDLDAELIGELRPLIGATKGESKFADAAYQGTYSCRVIRKPYTQGEVTASINNYCNGEDAKDKAKRIANDYRAYYKTVMEAEKASLDETLKSKIEDARKKILKKGGSDEDIKQRTLELENEYSEKKKKKDDYYNHLMNKARFIEFFHAGRACIVDGDNNTKAICLGAEIGTSTKNKFAPSNITIEFAVASAEKSLKYNIADNEKTKLEAIRGLSNLSTGYYDNTDYDKKYLEDWPRFVKESTTEREQRIIVVGNLLRGYKSAPEHSKLISFTTHDGEVMKGLLTPKNVMSNGDQKLILSRYSVMKFKPALKKIVEEQEKVSGERIINLTRGMVWKIDAGTFKLDCKQKDTIAKLEKSQDWIAVSDDGRGFQKRGSGSAIHYEMLFHDHLKFDDICEILDMYQFQVELTPREAEQYFGHKKDTLKQGNWKPLKTDLNNIPKSEPKPQKDRKRALALLQLAKAKLALAKAMETK